MYDPKTETTTLQIMPVVMLVSLGTPLLMVLVEVFRWIVDHCDWGCTGLGLW